MLTKPLLDCSLLIAQITKINKSLLLSALLYCIFGFNDNYVVACHEKTCFVQFLVYSSAANHILSFYTP